jgi:hypothetical protein
MSEEEDYKMRTNINESFAESMVVEEDGPEYKKTNSMFAVDKSIISSLDDELNYIVEEDEDSENYNEEPHQDSFATDEFNEKNSDSIGLKKFKGKSMATSSINSLQRGKNRKIIEEEEIVDQKLDDHKQKIIENNEHDGQLPIKAQMLLSPVRQYRLFKSIPWILIFHILVIAIDIVFLFWVAQPDYMLAIPSKMTLYRIFIDKNYDADSVEMH